MRAIRAGCHHAIRLDNGFQHGFLEAAPGRALNGGFPPFDQYPTKAAPTCVHRDGTAKLEYYLARFRVRRERTFLADTELTSVSRGRTRVKDLLVSRALVYTQETGPLLRYDEDAKREPEHDRVNPLGAQGEG